MSFYKNQGYQGGNYQLDSNTVLYDSFSEYHRNKATQGGVVFAINDSMFIFTTVKFESNRANDGAVLYGMYNSYDRALSFKDCAFNSNYAVQNLMQLMSSQAYVQSSSFTDNSATYVNHGITMITSTVEFYNSTEIVQLYCHLH